MVSITTRTPPGFPVLGSSSIDSVPFAMMVPFEERTIARYGSSLLTIAALGGLQVMEILLLVDPDKWKLDNPLTQTARDLALAKYVSQWKTKVVDEEKLTAFEKYQIPTLDDVPVGAMTYQPTMELRVLCPEGTHFPHQERLQQLWVTGLGANRKTEWRDIPRVADNKGGN